MIAPPKYRTVIHLDLDAFFVSVECLHNPALKGKPVVIGGDGNRGVVTSASYEARRFGVHAAMSARMARQLCPDAIFISGNIGAYTHYSKMITDIIAERAPSFEKASIDEFYLDITGMDRYIQQSEMWAAALRKTIMLESGLPISMGLSVNKLVSKVATNEAKPNGQKRVEYGLEMEFLGPLAIEKIPMIGKKTTIKLNDMGVHTVRELREMPVKTLKNRFGRHGLSLWRKAHGIDSSAVVRYSDRRSISTECTFHHERIDINKLKSTLTAMLEKLTFKLRKERWLTSCVTIKIRYTDFHTETKQAHLPYTSSDHVLIKVALDLFDKIYTRRMRLRLVGVRLSSLVHGNYQINMFDDTVESINLYQAMDQIRDKHGVAAIVRASTHGVNKRVRMENNVFRNV